jgi:uncharacterized protein
MRHLEIVLKTVETCNLNCSYCYFFSDTDGNYQIKKGREKIISLTTIQNICHFIKAGQKALQFDQVNIVFHGGEPLLQKKHEFDQMCAMFFQELSPTVKLEFGIQTNGICLSEKWLDLLAKYHISPGISIDGTEKYHNVYRKNFAGKGSYKQVARGIRLTQEAIKQNKISHLATISVIDARYCSEEIYAHFTKDLRVKTMDFLLPDFNHDTFPIHQQETGNTIEKYGDFICQLFDDWVKDDDPQIEIRLFKQIISLLAGGKYAYLADTGPEIPDDTLPIITIYHDGRVSPDDTFITTRPGITKTPTSVTNISLADFIQLPVFHEIKTIRKAIPKACHDCPWLSICNGGASVNRYSKKEGFNNPSIYCQALKKIYAHIASYMINNGLPPEKLHARLFDSEKV